MKNKITNIIKMGMLLGLTAITALCIASPVHAGPGKSPHHGGSGGGSFYATVTNVTQLIADINYAKSFGGDITINLAPGATFDLTSANNTTDGGNGLPVIGGTNAVALTIIGNGDTIERIAVISRRNTVQNPFRLFDVAPGASLTLDRVTLQGGWVSGEGGAVLNHGTLNVINGSTISGSAYYGGSIYNVGGTVTVNGSTLSDIYNAGGTLTVSDSTLYYMQNGGGTVAVSNSTGGGFNNGSGTLIVSYSTLSNIRAEFGGGMYISGGTVTVSSSTITNNVAYHSDYPWSNGDGGGIYNDGGTLTVSDSTISGNTAAADIGSGGDIFNIGTVTVENSSTIWSVYNLGLFYLDSTSAIVGGVGPTSATPF